MSPELESIMEKATERMLKIMESDHEAWVKAGKPYAFGPGTFPSIEEKVATELSDEWQGVRPHEETIYVRVA